jgi:GxxExxY protein
MSSLTGSEELNQITQKVIGCLYNVSNTLGGGFLEKVYQNSAAIEISKTGLTVYQQYPIKVKYDGIVVGEFLAD